MQHTNYDWSYIRDGFVSGPQLTESRRQSEIVNEGVMQQAETGHFNILIKVFRGYWCAATYMALTMYMHTLICALFQLLQTNYMPILQAYLHALSFQTKHSTCCRLPEISCTFELPLIYDYIFPPVTIWYCIWWNHTSYVSLRAIILLILHELRTFSERIGINEVLYFSTTCHIKVGTNMATFRRGEKGTTFLLLLLLPYKRQQSSG